MSARDESARAPRGVGCVIIGRNEGDRLERCLRSVVGDPTAPPARLSGASVVYVDSGSTDGSVARARRFGVEVVDLDLSHPFTAARARNEGFERLLSRQPDLEFVQFVDGDCEVVDGWLEQAALRLRGRPDLAIVAGRRRERYPEASIYNQLCDLEWDTPTGDAEACGGDSMARVEAFRRVGGFDARLICGEEPELCLRLRRLGYRIERLDAEMTVHDAAIDRFSQWWKRTVRAGYAYAEGASLHGRGPEQYSKRNVRRILAYGVLPMVALGAMLPTVGLSVLLLGAYPASAARIYAAERRRGRTPSQARLYAVACVLGRFPELQGVARYHADHWRGRRSRLIEYK